MNDSGYAFIGIYNICIFLHVSFVVFEVHLLLDGMIVDVNMSLQGYFQSLYLCIEELLVSLRIHHLVLPIAEDINSLWTNTMGFRKIARDKVFHFNLFF